MTLCSKDDVKSYLKKTDTDSDDQIDKLISFAQPFIEKYCGRVFEIEVAPAEVIEYHDGGVNRVFPKKFPVASSPALKVYEDSTRVFASGTLVNPLDYFVDFETGIIYFDYELERGWGAVKIVYTPDSVDGGTFSGDVAIAKQACIEIVARKLKTGISGDIGVTSRTMAAGSTVVFSQADILPETLVILNSLKS
jgi:hypothetical protein